MFLKKRYPRLILIRDDIRRVFEEDVIEISQDAIRTRSGVYPREKCLHYLSGRGDTYVINAPAPVAVEAERLASIADSLVLRQVFSYAKPEKVFTPLFWLATGLILALIVAIVRG